MCMFVSVYACVCVCECVRVKCLQPGSKRGDSQECVHVSTECTVCLYKCTVMLSSTGPSCSCDCAAALGNSYLTD